MRAKPTVVAALSLALLLLLAVAPAPAEALAELAASFEEMPVDYGFGFLSGYYCTGRVFDEPRRMRLKCTKSPPRKLNCKCDANGNTPLIRCDCERPVTHMLAPVPLVGKSERVTQDDVRLDPV